MWIISHNIKSTMKNTATIVHNTIIPANIFIHHLAGFAMPMGIRNGTTMVAKEMISAKKIGESQHIANFFD